MEVIKPIPSHCRLGTRRPESQMTFLRSQREGRDIYNLPMSLKGKAGLTFKKKKRELDLIPPNFTNRRDDTISVFHTWYKMFC